MKRLFGGPKPQRRGSNTTSCLCCREGPGTAGPPGSSTVCTTHVRFKKKFHTVTMKGSTRVHSRRPWGMCEKISCNQMFWGLMATLVASRTDRTWHAQLVLSRRLGHEKRCKKFNELPMFDTNLLCHVESALYGWACPSVSGTSHIHLKASS